MTNVKSSMKFWLMGILCLLSLASYSQGDPTDSLPGDPGGLSVYVYQNMNFGAFAKSNGGTITISNTGTRSSTGDVLLLNQGPSFFEAIFEIEAPPNSIVSVLNGSNVNLTRTGGGSITLALGACNPASPFNTVVSPPARTQLRIGGTLTVGNAAAAPPGSYTGTFSVTFNLE